MPFQPVRPRKANLAQTTLSLESGIARLHCPLHMLSPHVTSQAVPKVLSHSTSRSGAGHGSSVRPYMSSMISLVSQWSSRVTDKDCVRTYVSLTWSL